MYGHLIYGRGVTDQPAASERLADSTRGVSRHGFLVVVGCLTGCLTAGALEGALVRGAYTEASAVILNDRGESRGGMIKLDLAEECNDSDVERDKEKRRI
jgi:hypothetical protein